MGFLATTGGIAGEDVRDLMVAAVEYRFGQVNRLPVTIEWLSDNGSCYVAGDTRSFARDIGLEPRTTPLESPQSNGMAEAFVRTIKRDYVRVSPRPDAETVMRQLPAWIAHYNEVHPHKALGYRSPREFIAAHARPRPCPVVRGLQHLLLRSSLAILAARTRHLFSAAPTPAFSVASRPSNSSDIRRSDISEPAPRPIGSLLSAPGSKLVPGTLHLPPSKRPDPPLKQNDGPGLATRSSMISRACISRIVVRTVSTRALEY